MIRPIGMGFVTFVQRLSCSFSESVLLEFGVSTVMSYIISDSEN